MVGAAGLRTYDLSRVKKGRTTALITLSYSAFFALFPQTFHKKSSRY
jgi:hypothetical protein